MRGMNQTLSIGERIAWYRRRRGLSQEVLAGLVGRTADWLSKIENNRIDLDRLSTIKALADALDVQLADLLAEPSLLEWTRETHGPTVIVLRDVLMDYRNMSALLPASPTGAVDPDLLRLRQEVSTAWTAYQDGSYAHATKLIPALVGHAQEAVGFFEGDDLLRAKSLLALTYQSAAMVLTKLGEVDLAWLAADRGLAAAQESGEPVVIGSLFRSVSHCLLANGRFQAARQLTHDAADYLEHGLETSSPTHLSVYGTLFLVGAMAAAQDGDRSSANDFLLRADVAAQCLGRDANHLWTAFGPTNVAIHRVATALELGDAQLASTLGPRVDTTGLPTERRVRHAMELARAESALNRTDEALTLLLDAEQLAPEQVRYHRIPRQLVMGWIRHQRGRPSTALDSFARRLHLVH
ncbi:transcriptional regulator with XRE-family HTH domain [Streptacidiphilus sp. MAP12-20]